LSEPFRFGTKAETLAAIRDRVSTARVADLIYFTVAEWRADEAGVAGRVLEKFSGRTLAVRSSALGEDGANDSQAGANTSHLDVESDAESLRIAVEAVIASYRGSPRDQVLVQPMVADVAVSGVITTHVLTDGAPYYVLDYDDESGKTDTVTGGTRASKTVLVARDADFDLVESPRVRSWLSLIRELEKICPQTALDIEFGQTHDGGLHLFQVRRITVSRNWNRAVKARVATAQKHTLGFLRERSAKRGALLGGWTILGEMPDWNPAEIIGTTPRPLAASLYRFLITRSTWRRARGQMGYRDPAGEELMVMLGSRPYIDVRNSFNSFVPRDLADTVGEKLVEAWLARLAERPELHDKVEFEIAQTVCDFDFDRVHAERYPGLLSTEERAAYREALGDLTARLVDPSPEGDLERSMEQIAALEARQEERRKRPREGRGLEVLAWAKLLLYEARDEGALPFARVARHAFIAESLLRSAVARGALSEERLQVCKRSIRTITRDLSEDLARVWSGDIERGAFLSRYGHLRPGTYDVRSQRYDQRSDLLSGNVSSPRLEAHEFELSHSERSDLQSLLAEAGIGLEPEPFLTYARRAIAGRELAKFVFTRDLSDALEVLASWGESIGLTREDLSFLPLPVLLDRTCAPLLQDPELYLRDVAKRERSHAEVTQALHLGYLLRDERDVFVVPLHRSAPNFVTHSEVVARVAVLEGSAALNPDLYGAIVMIESADPGYDWIFGQGISGLITMWGGSNSHMAIRCTEFGIPAAIGCGEQTFARLRAAPRVRLACGDRLVEPVYG
jgi:hypothetical protein